MGKGSNHEQRNTESTVLPTAVRHRYQEIDREHYVLQGRDPVFTRCEDEVSFFLLLSCLERMGADHLRLCLAQMIHCPGAIQSYGVLLVLDEDEDGNLNVVQVSEVGSSLTNALQLVL